MNADTEVVPCTTQELIGMTTAETTALKTVRHPLRHPIVTGGYNPVVFDNDRTNFIPGAVRFFADRERYAHVVSVIVRYGLRHE